MHLWLLQIKHHLKDSVQSFRLEKSRHLIVHEHRWSGDIQIFYFQHLAYIPICE